MRFSGNGKASSERLGTIVKAFRGFSAHPGLQKNFAAPNQHRPLYVLREEPRTDFPCFLVCSPTCESNKPHPVLPFLGVARVRFAVFVLF